MRDSTNTMIKYDNVTITYSIGLAVSSENPEFKGQQYSNTLKSLEEAKIVQLHNRSIIQPCCMAIWRR